MKVIITGGAGFIGSHLVERLLKDKKIKNIVIVDYCKNGIVNIKHLLNNKRIKLVKLNIINLKKNNVNFKSADCVFHLAAIADIVPSITDPINYYHTNVNGTLNVLEAMRFNKIKKIVYAASSSCYGIPKKFPTSENDKVDLRFPYSLTKYQGEQLIVHWSHVYNIRYVSLRLFNVYGLRSRTSGAYGAVMGVFLKQKIANKPLTIVGDGNQTRDFVNVVDVADAFYRAFLLKRNNKIINIGSSLPIKIITLAKMISDNFAYILKRPGEPDKSHANILKAKKLLHWSPRVSFENGVKELLTNINFWKDAPLWNKKKIEKATKVWFQYLRK
jgi:UDP-glucose 4-epimerase